MATVQNFCLPFLTLLVVIAQRSPAQALLCPSWSEPYPCTCDNMFLNSIVCLGPNVTQEGLNHAMDEIRTLNQLTNEDYLYLSVFRIGKTDMTQLDLAPFLKISASLMYAIEENPLLERIYVSDGEEARFQSIQTMMLFITNSSRLTGGGLGDTLKYINPQNLQGLFLNNLGIQWDPQNLTDGTGDIELLPGMANLRDLNFVDLSGNQIEKIDAAPFKRLSKLTSLSLDQNGLTEVGPQAFFIEGHNATSLYGRHEIHLGRNEMADDLVDPQNGLDSWNGKTLLFLNDNKFASLSQPTLQGFLEANEGGNGVEFVGNRFKCESPMQWLRNDVGLAGRVGGLYCEGEYPPRTVFTMPFLE